MKEQRSQECPEQQGMYDPSFEHDNCGIGAVVNIKGIKSHKTVEDALSIVENLEHRAGKGARRKDRRRCRYHGSDLPQILLQRMCQSLELSLVERENMVLECFSCRRMN